MAFHVSFADSWPVNENEVEIVYSQMFQTPLTGFFSLSIALFFRRNFTGYEERISLNLRFHDSLPNLFFILVYAGSVNVSIASFKSPFHRLNTLATSDLVCAKT